MFHVSSFVSASAYVSVFAAVSRPRATSALRDNPNLQYLVIHASPQHFVCGHVPPIGAGRVLCFVCCRCEGMSVCAPVSRPRATPSEIIQTCNISSSTRPAPYCLFFFSTTSFVGFRSASGHAKPVSASFVLSFSSRRHSSVFAPTSGRAKPDVKMGMGSGWLSLLAPQGRAARRVQTGRASAAWSRRRGASAALQGPA